MEKVGFGGGCHWCTEGIFQSLVGIHKVEQGWIASDEDNDIFSEGVVVHFDPMVINLRDLINIHLLTHSSTSNHVMRQKYRSAVYVFSAQQSGESTKIIKSAQNDFDQKIITEVLNFIDFKLNKENQLNYLYNRPENSFCEKYIHPKLTMLLEKFRDRMDIEKIKTLNIK